MKKFLLLMSLAGAVGMTSSCKKSMPVINYSLSADAMAYIQLTPGKYFIYKDSVANVTDSVVVSQSAVAPTVNISNDVVYNEQQFTLVLTQIKPSPMAVWLSTNTLANLEMRVQLVSATNPYNFVFRDITTIIPSMVVEGKTYTNVSVTTNTLGTGFGQYAITSWYYWAKGTGLIKRRETVGAVTNTYTLLRNN